MATLIGRECWHVGAVLSHGKIIKHDLEAVAVIIDRGVAHGPITVHATQALLTIERAIDEAEEAADYWERKVKELRRLRDERENRCAVEGHCWVGIGDPPGKVVCDDCGTEKPEDPFAYSRELANRRDGDDSEG